MAADLKIHIQTDEITEQHLQAFFANTMGSPYFNPGSASRDDEREAREAILEAPSIHVCEQSTLKAGLTDDRDTYIPKLAESVTAHLGTRPSPIDDAVIADVKRVACWLDETDDESIYPVDATKAHEIVNFLQEHHGEQAFTVSW